MKLDIGIERYEEIRAELCEHGIETDDNADWVLSENNRYIAKLIVKDIASNGRVVLPVEDIIIIETFGHRVEVHTSNKTYQAFDRLYKIFEMLDPNKFLRVSNSVVIATSNVQEIIPTLSMKFVLTMTDGRKVDVTRSYYYIFREHFGI